MSRPSRPVACVARLAGEISNRSICDLIVSMEPAEISPRPVVGATVVVSGLAMSFLLSLLYVHHASADFAYPWIFLPALTPLLNAFSPVTPCPALHFLTLHHRQA